MSYLLKRYFQYSRRTRYLLKFLSSTLCCCLSSSALWAFFKKYGVVHDILWITPDAAYSVAEYGLLNLIIVSALFVGFFFRKKQDYYEGWHTNNIEEKFKNLEDSGKQLIQACHALAQSESQCKLLLDEHEKKENEIILKRKLLRDVIDIIPMMIFAKDDEGKFFLVNQKVAEVYGVHQRDMIGKTDADFAKNKKEVTHFLQQDQEVIERNIRKSCCETITDSNGSILNLKTWKRPFNPGTNKKGVLGVSMILEDKKE